MATFWTHAFFAAAGSKVAIGRRMPVRFWLLMATCGAIPDIDVIWRRFVSETAGIWGHRGITHSLLAAGFFGVLAACVCRTWKTKGVEPSPVAERSPWVPFLVMWLAFALATASHFVLDMLCSGYRGVALLAPFDSARYSFGWQPVWSLPAWVASIVPDAILYSGSWVVRVAACEVFTIWLPLAALLGVSWLIRRHRG